MQRLSIYTLMITMLFAACSKKATDQMVDKSTDMAKDKALAWRSTAPAPAEARPLKMGDYSKFMLDNGLNVIIVENHKLPRVSYQLSLNNDPILEGDQVGYVSFAGDLLQTGTKTKTKAEIDEAIDFIGASMNTSPRGIFASSLKKHSDKLLGIYTDVLYNPSFSQEEFDKLKTQTLSGIATTKTDPNAIASNVASVVNYGNKHPYGEVQTEKDVQNITLAKAKSYYDTYFKPNNATLVIVGDITESEAKAIVEKNFGSWKKGRVPTPSYDKPTSPNSTNVHFANKDGAVQSVIRVTYPIDLKPGAPDAIKASVTNNILGGGIFSGRLMQNLREDKAYTYGARSSISPDKLVGSFNAFASVRNEVTDSSVQEFLYEMKRMVDEPVSTDDLNLVKSSMTGSFARSLESPQTIARFARNIDRYNLPADYYETYLQKLNATTIADVTAMARKYIRPDRANIVVVGAKDEVADKLARFDSDGELTFYDAFGKEIKNNAIALPAGVTGASILKDYFAAIGGLDKVKSVKSLSQNVVMDMMGQKANIEIIQKDNNKLSFVMQMNGQVMQEQKFDGTTAKMSGMGQSQSFTEGPQFESVKDEAMMFPELDLLSNGAALNLKGIEDVDGKKAYKVEVVKGDDKEYKFFDVKSGLLIRSSSSQEGPDGSMMTISTDSQNYKAVNGIMFPHTIVSTGMAPFPIKMEVTNIKVNPTIDDATFKVD